MSGRGTSPRVLRPGVRIGRYRIVQRLGQGGMAEVYLAVSEGAAGFVKPVALKLVHAHLSHDDQLAKTLIDEARLAVRLSHPNIASVLDVGVVDAEHYLAMEYVHGRDLHAVLRASSPTRIPMSAALEIVRSVALALDYAHNRVDAAGDPLHLVHRDVSPSNVLVSYEGAVLLADFGIATVTTRLRTTQTGALKGKFGYMSPEQCVGADLDARSDVFALGILLYEATLGRRAFTGRNSVAVLSKCAAGDYVHPRALDPDYPTALAAVIERSLKVDPGERYESAAAFLESVDAYCVREGLTRGDAALASVMHRLFGESGLPEVPSLLPPTVATRSKSTRRWVIGLGATVAATAVLGVGYATVAAPAGPARVEPGLRDVASAVDQALPPEGETAPVRKTTPSPALSSSSEPAASSGPATTSASVREPEAPEPRSRGRARRRKAPKRRRREAMKPFDRNGMLPPSRQ